MNNIVYVIETSTRRISSLDFPTNITLEENARDGDGPGNSTVGKKIIWTGSANVEILLPQQILAEKTIPDVHILT